MASVPLQSKIFLNSCLYPSTAVPCCVLHTKVPHKHTPPCTPQLQHKMPHHYTQQPKHQNPMPHVLFTFAVQHVLVMTAVQHNQWRGINPIHCFDPCRGWFSLFYWYNPATWFPRQCPTIAFKIRGWSIRRDPSITHVRSMTIAGDVIRIMICVSTVQIHQKQVSINHNIKMQHHYDSAKRPSSTIQYHPVPSSTIQYPKKTYRVPQTWRSYHLFSLLETFRNWWWNSH